jgi:senataxin
LSAIADNIEVDTVDSFQGREKDIIIISCVRTDDTGFLKNSKRLNVALTRARHSLLIVGDAECLKKVGIFIQTLQSYNSL